MRNQAKIHFKRRGKSDYWSVNLPSAIAESMEFYPEEDVEWVISDKQHLILRRKGNLFDSLLKKKLYPSSE